MLSLRNQMNHGDSQSRREDAGADLSDHDHHDHHGCWMFLRAELRAFDSTNPNCMVEGVVAVNQEEHLFGPRKVAQDAIEGSCRRLQLLPL
jgi:hypothetical protein